MMLDYCLGAVALPRSKVRELECVRTTVFVKKINITGGNLYQNITKLLYRTVIYMHLRE